MSNHGAIACDFLAGAAAFVIIDAFDEEGFVSDLTSKGDRTIEGVVDDMPDAGVGFNEGLIPVIVVFGLK